MSPFFSMHIATRRDIEGTNPDAFGYAAATFVSFRLKSVKLSDLCSCLRNCFSTHGQTFSCGFKSGLYAGHLGNADNPHSFHYFIAASASGACSRGSPSSRIVHERRVGKAFFTNGPTRRRTIAANAFEEKGWGQWHNNCSPFNCYIVEITCFVSEINVRLRVQAISCYAWYDS
jgi:hypothetical protein